MEVKTRPGRPRATAPDGRATISQAAAELGLSYSGVYRYIVDATIDYVQSENGIITIARTDIERIRSMREPSEHAPGRSITIRPQPHVYEACKTAADRDGVSVRAWVLRVVSEVLDKGAATPHDDQANDK